MNSKHKKERPCLILGTPSTSSDSSYRPLIVTFNKIIKFYFYSDNNLCDHSQPAYYSHRSSKKKKEEKVRARSSARRGPGKLHNPNTHVSKGFYFYFKKVTVVLENYNRQSRSLHLKKLRTTNNNLKQKPQERKRKRKRRKRRKGGKEKRGEERYSRRRRDLKLFL